MSMIDIAYLFFLSVHGLRILAYYSQISTIARDTEGATAISLTTWALFALSHILTAIYAVVTADDWIIAGIFLANGAFSLAIIVLTMAKRRAITRSSRIKPRLGWRPAPTS